jgi:uncharacterized membrane protein
VTEPVALVMRSPPTQDPTGWRRRGVLLGLALAGLLIATYLTLYQVGVLASVWDPVFGQRASRVVLGLAEPVPDAAAGAVAYAGEIVLLLIGGLGRRRGKAWTCLALGAILAVGAVVSIALIVVQAVVARQWCLLCLGSAALSLMLFALGIGEARAAAGHVRRARERGVALSDALRAGAPARR